MAGSIVAYGFYVPMQRIKREEFVSALGACGADIKEKAVMDIDEDTLTMAVEAARRAITGIDRSQVGVLALASSNFPYQEKATAGTLVEALGLPGGVITSHNGGSSLAGAEAVLAASGMLGLAGKKYALVVISDAPSARVSDDADHGFGAAACAFVIGPAGSGLELDGACAVNAEYMGLRYRLPGEKVIRDIGVRAYSSGAYSQTVTGSVLGLMEKMGGGPGRYRHLVMPGGGTREDSSLAKKMGFSDEQTADGMIYSQVGDAGCCTPFLGLCKVLESAAPGGRIIVCAHGAGSASISLSFTINGRPPSSPVSWGDDLGRKKYISYYKYLRLKGII